jgi:hypothetical protein
MFSFLSGDGFLSIEHESEATLYHLTCEQGPEINEQGKRTFPS